MKHSAAPTADRTRPVTGPFPFPLRLDFCRGVTACPNACLDPRPLVEGLEALGGTAPAPTGGHFHRAFTISLSLCPNGCSRPQIADIGIIGAALPRITDIPCVGCRECAAACPEGICTVTDDPRPVIGADCLACRLCVRACPMGTLATGQQGYRIQVGGRLGRRPRLAAELPGIHDAAETLDIVKRILAWYVPHAREGRLGDLLARHHLDPVRFLE